MDVRLMFILLTSCLSSAQDTEDDSDSRVIDLQELLLNVSSVMGDFQKVCQNRKEIPKLVQAQDCADLYLSGKRGSRVYFVHPVGFEKSSEVYCDMRTDGGGWTVFQRRGDYGYPDDYFYKTWAEYKLGFGNLYKEFWLGNDLIAALSLQGKYQLRVDLIDMNRVTAFAKFDSFWIDHEAKNYKLHVDGYTGSAGDSLVAAHNHTEQEFSTRDRGKNVCADAYKGGWWYNSCHGSNLNGLNLKGEHESYADGIEWASFKGLHYSLYSEMKIRPAEFNTAM